MAALVRFIREVRVHSMLNSFEKSMFNLKNKMHMLSFPKPMGNVLEVSSGYDDTLAWTCMIYTIKDLPLKPSEARQSQNWKPAAPQVQETRRRTWYLCIVLDPSIILAVN